MLVDELVKNGVLQNANGGGVFYTPFVCNFTCKVKIWIIDDMIHLRYTSDSNWAKDRVKVYE